METLHTNVLDVTVLDPRLKHPTIFKRFDELHEGETLVIHNDHDPRPLYYQMINERGPIFQWQYLEEGPVWWKVRITRRENATETDQTIGEILSKDIRKAGVFKKYGIDFCCGGKKTVGEACREKGIDPAQLERDLNQPTGNSPGRPLPFHEWSPGFLADYIVNTHHAYVKAALPELKDYALKVVNAHGDVHPELAAIQQLVEKLNEELLHHLAKEENVLFPYVKDLAATRQRNMPLRESHFGTVRNPITMMELEHDTAGRLLEEIRTLSNQFSAPQDACASYTFFYKLLEEFESDLHIHIHLENNILFPRAIELETELTA